MLLLALALFAQTAMPQLGSPVDPERVYTVADPVRPDGLGLVTHDGRFSISRGDGCDAIGPEQNVELFHLVGFNRSIAVLAPLDSDTGEAVLDTACPIRFEQQMSAQPCWTNEAGLCDIAAENAGP